MTTTADRRMLGARNQLVDLLGLGESLPLRHLPVAAAPAIVPFGGTATVTIEDSEPGVEYRLRGQAGAALPEGAIVTGIGDGGTLALVMSKIHEPISFTLEAAKPSGRTALLLRSAPVAIGLDSAIPATVAGFDGVPVLIDFDATITVTLAYSQEAVSYQLVARPPGDTAAVDDLAALDSDIILSEAAVRGTGAPIALRSKPLRDDGIVRVRMVKAFPGRRETQVSLLATPLAVHVRADRGRPTIVTPQIADHGQAPALSIAKPQPGVAYALYLAPVADTQFDRATPPDPATLAVAWRGGGVHVLPPRLPTVFEPLPGYAPAGAAKTGDGAELALPLPALARDTLAIVAATKQHGSGDAQFSSTVPLAQAAVALVRPSPSPDLRIEASITGDALTGLRAFGGEPGVFYALSIEDKALGQLYMHQRDAEDASRNKGVNLLAVGIDLVIAADATSAAPPPPPRLDLAAAPLPIELGVVARRAMTGLEQPLAARITLPAPPAISVERAAGRATAPRSPARAVRAVTPLPANIAVEPVVVGGPVRITLAQAAASARHVLLIDGAPFGEPVPGTDGPLLLASDPLRPDGRIEVLILDPPRAGIALERRIAVPAGDA